MEFPAEFSLSVSNLSVVFIRYFLLGQSFEGIVEADAKVHLGNLLRNLGCASAIIFVCCIGLGTEALEYDLAELVFGFDGNGSPRCEGGDDGDSKK